jgi:predicted dehydrogenase
MTKIAVIGAGGMLKHHAKGFLSANATITAIADIDANSARKAAEQWDVPAYYTDVRTMLSESDADAVSIIVPNKFHCELAVQCLNAGRHVFCEKPPALNAAEVRRMMDAAEANRKLLMFNFNNRARPESVAVIAQVRRGTIGRINSAQAKWIRRTGIPGFGGWFTTKELAGGGPLIDLLHMMDLALYFMEYPQPAHVLGSTFDDFISNKSFKGPWGIPDCANGTTNVETAAHGLVTFRSGQVLTVQASWAEMVEREEVSVAFQGKQAGGRIRRLFGTDGIDETAVDSCEIFSQENGKSVNRSIRVEPCEDMGRSRSAQNFVLAVEGKEQPLNHPREALLLMQMIDAIYQSARTRQPVSFDNHVVS